MCYHVPTAEGAPKELCDRLEELVDAHSDTIIGLSQYLYANPEMHLKNTVWSSTSLKF